jgi:hypothetical protein
VVCPAESMFWQGIIRILQADGGMEVLRYASPRELAISSAGSPLDVRGRAQAIARLRSEPWLERPA